MKHIGHQRQGGVTDSGPEEVVITWWTIPRSVIEAVRADSRLEDVASDYTVLRKIGRYLVGLCPFHEERTPSFYVYPEDQYFKCFGCGAWGDVFSFFQKVAGRTFQQAVNYLAHRAGIDVDSPANRREIDAKDPLAKDIRRAVRRLEVLTRAVLLECREGLHRLAHVYQGASGRLDALAAGASERWPAESDRAFEVLDSVGGRIRRLEAAYYVVAFGAASARARFVLHPDERETMIDEALLSGHVGNANAIKSTHTDMHALLREQPELIQQINRAGFETEPWPTQDEINAICLGAFNHE